MKTSKSVIIYILLFFTSFIIANAAVYAQEDASTQQTKKEIDALRTKIDHLEKTVANQAELIAQQKHMLDRIMESVPELKTAMVPPEPKTLVKSFVLDGANLFQPSQFEPILKKYRDQELGMSDLEKIGDEIGAFYRSRGYVSSIAYLPTQEITDNTVEFNVVEGRVGDIEIEKPKYSKLSTVKNRFLVEKGEVLDSKKMEASLERINKNRDRTMRAVLTPGQAPETTDILLKVEKERSPHHFYVDFNNRGTNTTRKTRWGVGYTNTNLLGWDDVLSARFIAGPRTEDVYSVSGDYNLPVNRYDTRVGGYAVYAHSDIGGQFAIISPEGRAHALGVYATHPLFKKEFIDEESQSKLTLGSNLTAGFDYINVQNKIMGEKTSHDKISAIKGGINFDEKDSLGRTMASAEIRAGLPGFLGSMAKHDKYASRAPSDAGGKFQKYLVSANRTTYLPFNSAFLNTFRFQFTPNPLVTPEQMVIGGADTVRGYPENDYLADYGWIANFELRTPAWLIPPQLKVPFDKKQTRLIDAIQFTYFLDAGKGYLHKSKVGEVKSQYLVGSGLGLRFDLHDRIRGRVDFAFPTGGHSEPSDRSSYRIHYGFQFEW